MKSVILGTAGHVDHGKTVLIEALTGVNTDRWEEERQRGITIDLGFAPFPIEAPGLEISVVDVPGHEDFVRNMLAGATGFDVLLLVVAADEGPMPQTREHLWIARYLGVERGVVAISKSDLAEADWCALVGDATREEIERIFGACDWPVLPVSATTGQGLDALRSAISEVGRQVPVRSEDDLFRLPVDRSFSVRGVGTVATGTVWSGRVSTGEEVRILPQDRRARVRGVQVHGRDLAEAHAGQRAALALVGVDRAELSRGDTLTADEEWRVTRRLGVELEVVPHAPHPVKQWQRVRLHLGTAETLARVALPGGGALRPGERGTAELRLEEPLVARAGDRFVIRFYSPVTTIGGGVVLDPWAVRRGRRGKAGAVAALGAPGRLLDVLADRGAGATLAELALLSGRSPTELRGALGALAADGSARELGGRWYAVEALAAARARVLDALSRGHAEDRGAAGVSLESLRSAAQVAPEVANAVIAGLEADRQIRIDGSVAAHADHVPRLRPEQERVAEAACSRLRASELTPPTVKELAGELDLGVEDLLPVLKFLRERGELVAVTADLYFTRGAISEVRQRVTQMLAGGRAATPSELRQALGVSRKYLIPLLEHLDATGITRRSGAGRVLRDEA